MPRLAVLRPVCSLLLVWSACSAPEVTSTCAIHETDSAATALTRLSSCADIVTDDPIDTRRKRDVDILFVVDNSPSMSPKQKQIASTIDSFIKRIDSFGSNYHVGVVSTDIGAQPAPGMSFSPGNVDIAGCATFAGDDGELQAKSCLERDQSKWSADARAACASLCPTYLSPQHGDRYLWKKDGITNAVGNDLVGTFKCMAMLGDSGCGLESPLEAAKRALDGHSAVNSGFLRERSVLSVIFITDEDDCSVQLSSRSQNNPATTDCTGMMQSSASCFNNDFRCLARNLRCKESLLTEGVKTGCAEDPNGYLESIDKYVRFFAKRDSSSLVLAGIWSPSILDNPSGDPLRDGKLELQYDNLRCVPGSGVTCESAALNRGRSDKAACQNKTDTRFFGQAQLRLSKFVRSFDRSASVEQSVCEPEKYGTVLDAVAEKIENAATKLCLSAVPKRDSSGAPLCVAGLVDASNPHAVPEVRLPTCSATCCAAWSSAGGPKAPTAKAIPSDPTIVSACSADPNCYCAVDSPVCPQTALAGVWMQSSPHQTPSDKVVSLRCAAESQTIAP